MRDNMRLCFRASYDNSASWETSAVSHCRLLSRRGLSARHLHQTSCAGGTPWWWISSVPIILPSALGTLQEPGFGWIAHEEGALLWRTHQKNWQQIQPRDRKTCQNRWHPWNTSAWTSATWFWLGTIAHWLSGLERFSAALAWKRTQGAAHIRCACRTEQRLVKKLQINWKNTVNNVD